jgi:hypothetical protein
VLTAAPGPPALAPGVRPPLVEIVPVQFERSNIICLINLPNKFGMLNCCRDVIIPLVDCGMVKAEDTCKERARSKRIVNIYI